MNPIKLPASYYQQFDADYSRDVPGEGYGGWKKSAVELAPDHTALVVMHAWDCGTLEQWPGWRKAVEYYPRSLKIVEEVFPALLAAVRATPIPVFHVVGWMDYYQDYPGYPKVEKLAGPSPEFQQVQSDPVYDRMQSFRADRVFVGAHNRPDVEEGRHFIKFPEQARPVGDEGIAKDGHQLAALCREHQVNHLVYIGFAINWCLLMSPAGMVDMSRYGMMCSTIREAVTAVENAETAREEREKQQALWRVAINSGFVFGVDDFKNAMGSLAKN
jgi:nicotinamidase-related amidase